MDSVCEISDENRKHIFTPFYTGRNQHGKDGNGLGLPLSKKLLKSWALNLKASRVKERLFGVIKYFVKYIKLILSPADAPHYPE